MIRQSLIAVGAALFVAVAGYGISQAAGQGALASKSSPNSLDPDERTRLRYEKIIESLKLTPKQKADYDKLCAWMKAETVKMKQLGSGAMARGMEMNAEWRAGLKRIFTKAQWEKYVTDAGYSYLLKEEKGAVANPTGHFKNLEEKILSQLGLSVRQKQEIRLLQEELDRENAKLRELWQGTDADAVTRQGVKINKMQNAGMKKILTPEQHAKYKQLWAEAMPKPKPDGKVYSPMRPAPGRNRIPPP